MAKRGRPKHPDILTPREWEVLALIREGLPNEEIAARLGISVDGAKYHVSQILMKLAVPDRLAAARWRPEEEPRPRWAAFGAPLVALRTLRPAYLSYAVLGCMAVLLIAGIGVLAWALVATNGDDDAAASACDAATPNANPNVHSACELVVWILDPDTGEAEMVPDSEGLTSAQWVEDGQTFVAQHGPGGTVGLYDAHGQLLTTILEVDRRVEAGKPIVNVSARALDDGETVLLTRATEYPEQTREFTLFDLATGEERPVPAFLANAVNIEYSPDGATVAYVDYDGTTWSLIAANADGENSQTLQIGTEGEILSLPSWSPDGSQLLYRQDDVSRVIELQGEEVWASPPDARVSYRWAGPNRLLVATAEETPEESGDQPIYYVQKSPFQLLLAELLPPSLLQPFFSPDGNYVVTQRRDKDNEFIGFITRIGTDGLPSETDSMPREIALPAIVDWTANSSLALLSTP